MDSSVPVECMKFTNSLAKRTEVYIRKELLVVQITLNVNFTKGIIKNWHGLSIPGIRFCLLLITMSTPIREWKYEKTIDLLIYYN